MQDALDVIAQYSYADQNRRLQKDAEKIIRLNESKAKKPIKYAGFINKFKRFNILLIPLGVCLIS